MDIREKNRELWDREVDKGNKWTLPVSSEIVDRARKGDFRLILTPSKPVPKNWYPPLVGARVLCLASGGGQQGPIFAAAGAKVTVFDNSPKQLGQDRLVADRDGLELETVEGDMRDLSCFENSSFDFIFHPCSNCFVDVIRPVWKEAYRVLRSGGTMISGFANPLMYLFDPEMEKKGVLQLRFKMPYSDLTSVTEAERLRYFGDEPICFGHSLEDQIGGQVDAGFHIIGLYEDEWGSVTEYSVDKHFKGFLATRALKP